jgi:Alginate lyase
MEIKMMVRLALAAVAAAHILAGAAHAGPVTVNAEELVSLRSLVSMNPEAKKRFAELREQANGALDDAPKPIADIADAAERLESAENAKRSTGEAAKDMAKIDALAWTWALTNDERYAAKARLFIVAWAKTNVSDGHAIKESVFERLIEGYDLLRPGFAANDRTLVDDWLKRKADLLLKDERVRRENWESHRLKIVGLVATTTGDDKLWNVTDAGFRKHVGVNFNTEGESVDFRRRDAMHYHVYAVQPLLTLACVAKRRGDPIYNYRAANGASLERAVEFIRPYALGEKKHLEFAKSEVGMDRKRAAAGEKEYAPHYWSGKSASTVFAEAGCLDLKYNALAEKVLGSGKDGVTNWRSVLNIAESK